MLEVITNMTETIHRDRMVQDKTIGYNRFLLLVAGLGGLLYGVDVGIIGGALPYLEATSGLNAGELSIIVAAVLFCGTAALAQQPYAGMETRAIKALSDQAGHVAAK